jgi:hypothetical protein
MIPKDSNAGIKTQRPQRVGKGKEKDCANVYKLNIIGLLFNPNFFALRINSASFAPSAF